MAVAAAATKKNLDKRMEFVNDFIGAFHEIGVRVTGVENFPILNSPGEHHIGAILDSREVIQPSAAAIQECLAPLYNRTLTVRLFFSPDDDCIVVVAH